MSREASSEDEDQDNLFVLERLALSEIDILEGLDVLRNNTSSELAKTLSTASASRVDSFYLKQCINTHTVW